MMTFLPLSQSLGRPAAPGGAKWFIILVVLGNLTTADATDPLMGWMWAGALGRDCDTVCDFEGQRLGGGLKLKCSATRMNTIDSQGQMNSINTFAIPAQRGEAALKACSWTQTGSGAIYAPYRSDPPNGDYCEVPGPSKNVSDRPSTCAGTNVLRQRLCCCVLETDDAETAASRCPLAAEDCIAGTTWDLTTQSCRPPDADCPAGFWKDLTGSQPTCERCGLHAESAAGSTAITACKCAAGYWGDPSKEVLCTSCEDNGGESTHTSPPGSTSFTACVCGANKYNAGDRCILCGIEGTSNLGSTASGCRCAAGYWNDQTREPVCVSCGVSSQSSPAGLMSSAECKCQKDYWNNPDASPSVCVPCANSSGSRGCSCPAGRWRDLTEMESVACHDCSVGKFSNASGRSACDNCEANQVSSIDRVLVQEGATNCSRCPRGAIPDTVRATCVTCSPGTYRSKQVGNADSTCIRCPIRGVQCLHGIAEFHADAWYSIKDNPIVDQNTEMHACFNDESCVAGAEGIACDRTKGYMGALCGGCDLNNEQGAGSFTRSGSKCEECWSAGASWFAFIILGTAVLLSLVYLVARHKFAVEVGDFGACRRSLPVDVHIYIPSTCALLWQFSGSHVASSHPSI